MSYQVAWAGAGPRSQGGEASQVESSRTLVAGTAVAGTDRLAAEVDCTGVAAWGAGWRGGTAVRRGAVGGAGWGPRVEVAQHWILQINHKGRCNLSSIADDVPSTRWHERNTAVQSPLKVVDTATDALFKW